ncbi:response regulator [Pseudoalteromonas sp. 68 DY56-GL68]|uniref:response regulator n=1 Tax=Pseudoalteromonas sp. 68 DY56-GL68 TaxID=2974919 RepID=UPI00352A845C
MNLSPQANPKKSIFLVEDDLALSCLIRDFLERYQFNVSVFSNGAEAAKEILRCQPDLVILDIMLPGMNGLDVCRQIRSEYRGFIMMQTALDDDIDQMLGLEIGADDYIVKQVQPRLLLTRINALLRRSQRANPYHPNDEVHAAIECGPLVINLSNRSVTLNRHSVELTSAEFELLVLLARSIGKVVSRDDIIQTIRGFEYDGLDRSIDRRVSRLRKKLHMYHPEEMIKTVRGLGYQLCVY